MAMQHWTLAQKDSDARTTNEPPHHFLFNVAMKLSNYLSALCSRRQRINILSVLIASRTSPFQSKAVLLFTTDRELDLITEIQKALDHSELIHFSPSNLPKVLKLKSLLLAPFIQKCNQVDMESYKYTMYRFALGFVYAAQIACPSTKQAVMSGVRSSYMYGVAAGLRFRNPNIRLSFISTLLAAENQKMFFSPNDNIISISNANCMQYQADDSMMHTSKLPYLLEVKKHFAHFSNLHFEERRYYWIGQEAIFDLELPILSSLQQNSSNDREFIYLTRASSALNADQISDLASNRISVSLTKSAAPDGLYLGLYSNLICAIALTGVRTYSYLPLIKRDIPPHFFEHMIAYNVEILNDARLPELKHVKTETNLKRITDQEKKKIASFIQSC